MGDDPFPTAMPERQVLERERSGQVSPGFALKSGVSFCRVSDRTVFLDLSADRYFCLSSAGERSFSRLVDSKPLSSSDAVALGNLAVNGPLIHTEVASAITPCPAIELPVCSLLDEQAGRPRLFELLAAGPSLFAAPLLLRLYGLHALVERLRSRKARVSTIARQGRQTTVATAFKSWRYVATEQDHCLTRSVAVASRLISVGARPELIIAVKLRPFAAHAWVQCDGCLVNDRHEFVRDYTPILII